MDIYSFPTFNLTKVLLTAEEVGEPYYLHILDPTKGEHKLPEHLARHPLGKVPAVKIDGEYFFESGSIIRLLAERHNSLLYGNSPVENARISQWMDLFAHHIGRLTSTFFWEEVVKPNLLDEAPSQSALAEAQGFLDQQLPVLEQQLHKHEFVIGDRFTLADIVGFSYFDIAESLTLDLSVYPSIRQWIARITSRPTYRSAMEKLPGRSMAQLLLV